jgi:hypothetical protein
MNENAFKLGLFVLIASLTSCDVCEVKGTVTFDNSERLWCNCEVTWQNGDVYVIDAGEVRTYEFFRGNQSFRCILWKRRVRKQPLRLRKKELGPALTTSIAVMNT